MQFPILDDHLGLADHATSAPTAFADLRPLIPGRITSPADADDVEPPDPEEATRRRWMHESPAALANRIPTSVFSLGGAGMEMPAAREPAGTPRGARPRSRSRAA